MTEQGLYGWEYKFSCSVPGDYFSNIFWIYLKENPPHQGVFCFFYLHEKTHLSSAIREHGRSVLQWNSADFDILWWSKDLVKII